MYVLLVHVVSGVLSMLSHSVLSMLSLSVLFGVSSVSMLLCSFGCRLLVHPVVSVCNRHGVLLLVCCPAHSILSLLDCTEYVLYLDCFVMRLVLYVLWVIVVWL